MERYFRVRNTGDEAFAGVYDGVEYTVAPGGEGVMVSEAVARHLAEYARQAGKELQLEALELTLAPEPKVHRCPFSGCGFAQADVERYAAHVREHAMRQAGGRR